MTETIKACPLCRETEFQPFWIYKHKTRPNNVFDICARCGAVFANPRPTKTELAEYYQGPYREQVDGDGKPTPTYVGAEYKRAQRLMWWCQRYVPTIKRHMDIGSSAGFLLNNFYVQFKCESVGVEPNDEYRKESEKGFEGIKQGATLYADISEVPQSPKFDLITMSHVLEHLPDPIGYLENLVNSYLEPNGHILIEVPNLLGEVTALIYPHLIGFTQDTLWTTMNKAGLNPVAVETSYVGGQIHLAPPPYLTALGKLGDYDRISGSREVYGRVIRQFMGLLDIRDRLAKEQDKTQP